MEIISWRMTSSFLCWCQVGDQSVGSAAVLDACVAASLVSVVSTRVDEGPSIGWRGLWVVAWVVGCGVGCGLWRGLLAWVDFT